MINVIKWWLTSDFPYEQNPPMTGIIKIFILEGNKNNATDFFLYFRGISPKDCVFFGLVS